jgi:ureidoacrylate peracid hydrolase
VPKLTVATATKADRERPVEPDKTALLSIDMQNAEWTAERAEAARAGADPKHATLLTRITDVVIPGQQRLQAAARAAGVEVIYTVIEALTQDGRDISLDHKISGIFVPKGSWEARPIAEIGPVGDEIVIPKTASGLFNCTNIEYVLRNLGIEYLVIYGIVTDQCVETAVRDACDRGFLVTLVEDCCAAYTPEDHDQSIASMDGHYARVRSADDMIAELTRITAARPEPVRGA